ncbi:hypothetical protein [Microbacterium candidum]|uniref:hypothetical protein n=1 Tax=Microbacterium candidum TaxID=3041922 RepID=UPI00257442BF|nr:hypothetical protein [Microbacterium sp. ASV49]
MITGGVADNGHSICSDPNFADRSDRLFCYDVINDPRRGIQITAALIATNATSRNTVDVGMAGLPNDASC